MQTNVVAVLGEILCAGVCAKNDDHHDQLFETAQKIKKFSVLQHSAKNSNIQPMLLVQTGKRYIFRTRMEVINVVHPGRRLLCRRRALRGLEKGFKGASRRLQRGLRRG